MLDVLCWYLVLVVQIVFVFYMLVFDKIIVGMIGKGDIGEVIIFDVWVVMVGYFKLDLLIFWCQDWDLFGNNIMFMGIWYEVMMCWVGFMFMVFVVGQVVVFYCVDEVGCCVIMIIFDYLDIVGKLE